MTAAPGPQQPDEDYAETVRRGVVDPYCPEHGHLSTAYSSCSCPAAPSAQPDEVPVPMYVEFRCGDCGHVHDEDRRCLSQKLGADTVCNCPRWVPAQPVRDTEEGRR